MVAQRLESLGPKFCGQDGHDTVTDAQRGSAPSDTRIC